MEGNWIVGVVLVVALLSFEVWVLWRYPDFRRAFFHYWSASEIAKRLNAWSERQRNG